MAEKIYNYKTIEVTSITVGDNDQQKKVNELLKKFKKLFPDVKVTSFNGVISYITEHYTDFGYDTKKALNAYLNKVSKDKDVVDNVMSLIDNYNAGNEETTPEPTPEPTTDPEPTSEPTTNGADNDDSSSDTDDSSADTDDSSTDTDDSSSDTDDSSTDTDGENNG